MLQDSGECVNGIGVSSQDVDTSQWVGFPGEAPSGGDQRSGLCLQVEEAQLGTQAACTQKQLQE